VSSTDAYYNQNALQFVDDTLHVDMRCLYVRISSMLAVVQVVMRWRSREWDTR